MITSYEQTTSWDDSNSIHSTPSLARNSITSSQSSRSASPHSPRSPQLIHSHPLEIPQKDQNEIMYFGYSSSPPEVNILTSHFVQALHDYIPEGNSTSLTLRRGQIIEVMGRDDSGWWMGECEGRQGWFPSNYVGLIGDSVISFDRYSQSGSPALSQLSSPIIEDDTEAQESHRQHLLKLQETTEVIRRSIYSIPQQDITTLNNSISNSTQSETSGTVTPSTDIEYSEYRPPSAAVVENAITMKQEGSNIESQPRKSTSIELTREPVTELNSTRPSLDVSRQSSTRSVQSSSSKNGGPTRAELDRALLESERRSAEATYAMKARVISEQEEINSSARKFSLNSAEPATPTPNEFRNPSISSSVSSPAFSPTIGLGDERFRRTSINLLLNTGLGTTSVRWEKLIDNIVMVLSNLNRAAKGYERSALPAIGSEFVTAMRDLLDAAGIVEQDSQLLRQYPQLAKEKKAVLDSLSKLVKMCRELGGVDNKKGRPRLTESGSGMDDDHQTPINKLRPFTEQLLLHFKNFIAVAQGIPIPLVAEDEVKPDTVVSGLGIITKLDLNRRSSNSQSRVSLDGDQHTTTPTQSTPSSPRRVSESTLPRRRPSIAASTIELPDSEDEESIKKTLLAIQKCYESVMDMVAQLNALTDASKLSSKSAADLVEIARSIVTKVRSILTVAEHICSNRSANPRSPALGVATNSNKRSSAASTTSKRNSGRTSMIPSDPHLVALLLSKEALYMATGHFVTAVRALTSSVSAPSSRKSLDGEEDEDSEEEDERDHLRASCANVLRALSECITEVRACMGVSPSSSDPTEMQRLIKLKATLESRDGSRLRLSKDLRSKHTLSFLGRKETSLQCLQEMYMQADASDEVHDNDDSQLKLPPSLMVQRSASFSSIGSRENDPMKRVRLGSAPSARPLSTVTDQSTTSTPSSSRRSSYVHDSKSGSDSSSRRSSAEFQPLSSVLAENLAISVISLTEDTQLSSDAEAINSANKDDNSTSKQPISPSSEQGEPSSGVSLSRSVSVHRKKSNSIRQTLARASSKNSMRAGSSRASPAGMRISIDSSYMPTPITTPDISETEAADYMAAIQKKEAEKSGSDSTQEPTKKPLRRSRAMSVSNRDREKDTTEESRLRNSMPPVPPVPISPKYQVSAPKITLQKTDDGTSSDEEGTVIDNLEESLPQSPVLTLVAPTDYSPAGEENWFLRYYYDEKDDIILNADEQVIAGTIEALVERLTSFEKPMDVTTSTAFLLNFRLFTTPVEFAEYVISRFSIHPPTKYLLTDEQLKSWSERVLIPVRLRVYNVLKTWLESYWQPDVDAPAMEIISEFVDGQMMATMNSAAARMQKIIERVITSPITGSARQRLTLHRQSNRVSQNGDELFSFGEMADEPSSRAKKSNISRSLLNQLRHFESPHAIHLTDFDPLEFARQLTLMESRVFSLVQPHELVGKEHNKPSNETLAINVKGMSALSTQMTNWIIDTILFESDVKKRANVIKFWIKVADKCLGLNNYNTLMAIRSALDTSSIRRLRKTWDIISSKWKGIFEVTLKATDTDRNFAEYRHRLINANPPCLPFLGVYLTDLTFIEDGNSKTRKSLATSKPLINFDRYVKSMRVITEIQRFQVVPYDLNLIPEVQSFVRKSLNYGNQDQSREEREQAVFDRSLELEPREDDRRRGTIARAAGFNVVADVLNQFQ